MNREEIIKIALKEKETRLSISRLPKEIKKDFVEYAEKEFCGDYGMTLAWCFRQSMEYQWLKGTMFNGQLNDIFEKLSHIKKHEENTDDKSMITLMSGRKVMKGGKQKNE